MEDNNYQVSSNTETKKIFQKSSVYVIGYALSSAVGFLMVPIYTKFIAPSEYGGMEMIEIFMSAITILVTMGVSEGMARFYYEKKELSQRNEVVSTFILGFSCLAIPIISIFYICSGPISRLVLDVPEYQYYFKIVLATIWFAMLCEFGLAYLRILYKAKLFIFVTVSQLIIALSLNIWFVVFQDLGILGIFYSGLITKSIVGLLLAGMIIKKIGCQVDFILFCNLIRFGLPLVPSRIGLFLGFVSNRFFLRYYGAADPALALTQVGIYSLGHKFGNVISRFINSPFNAYWGPRRLELLLSGDQADKNIVGQVATYAFFCSMYASLLLSCGIENILEIIADPRYLGAHVVVPFVALSYVALGLENQINAAIIVKKRTIFSTYITFISLAVVLLWNYIFIPRWGIIGAATSNLAGFCVRLLLIYIVSQKIFFLPYEIRRILTLFVVAIVGYFLSGFICFSSPYTNFLMRTLFAALYPFWLLPLRFYTREETSYFKRYCNKIACKLRGR